MELLRLGSVLAVLLLLGEATALLRLVGLLLPVTCLGRREALAWALPLLIASPLRCVLRLALYSAVFRVWYCLRLAALRRSFAVAWRSALALALAARSALRLASLALSRA